MMGRLAEEVLRRADIVEVVSSYIPLKKRGANYWALSPFKPEKTPSFAVSPSKQIFKCFSSGKGGNVIRFVMEMEGISYGEALRKLAERYGIPVTEELSGVGGNQPGSAISVSIGKWCGFIGKRCTSPQKL
jgi:DNA primase